MDTKKRQALDLQDILDRLRTGLPYLRVRYRVSSLGVFGSYVRG